MRVAKMPYLQLVDGSFRVRVTVPPELQPHLPPPHTGKANLTKALGTGNEREANRLAVPWIAEFQAAITAAAKVQRNPDLHDWIARYAYHHPDGNAFAPEQRIITPNPAIALPAKPVSFESMIEKWANYTNAPKKGRQNMETKCGDFIAYLGHDNMAQVTFENCGDYRDFLIDEHDLASSTIGNYLKALKALFTYAFDNYPDDFLTNAMARIKYQAGDGEERDDFIPEERARILTAAREAGPVIRWLNWLSSFNGGRLSELVEADTRDIVMKEGVWVMEIKKTIRIPDQRRKTKVSSRDAPLHSALLAEGFLEYVESIKKEYGDGPLFPQVSLDAYGRRNGKVSKPISKWLRNVVGIRDPNKPFHSHRHTATSFLRNTRLPDGSPSVKEDVERYLLGHARKGAHGGYGKQWIETLKAAIEIIPNASSATSYR
jgi:integrase